MAKSCQFYFVYQTPSVYPDYSVAFAQPMPCLVPAQYPPVHYYAWLPPFQRTVYIQRFPAEINHTAASPDARIAKSR